MKKLQMFLIGLAALMLTSMASAQEVVYPNLDSGSNTITMLNCTLLANDIRLILTGGVIGGVTCDTANVAFGLSVCHTSGLTTSRSVSTVVPTGGCVDPLTLTGEGESARCTGTITGSGYPTATSLEGTVSSRYPGDACTMAIATAQSAAAIADVLAAE